jgi:hypothetical protein
MRRAPFVHPATSASFDQMSDALIDAVTFGLIAIFVAAYRLLVRPKSLRAGLRLGGFLGLALGTSVGSGTSIHAQIPLALAWGWSLAGSIKDVAAGTLLGATGRSLLHGFHRRFGSSG